MGLAITKAFTDLMGGSIELTEVEPHGTNVTMRWSLPSVDSWRTTESITPAMPSSAPFGSLFSKDSSGVSLPPSSYPDSKTRYRHRVLVVDDDPMLREVVANVLESMGIFYDVAHNGEEALRKLRSAKYTSVIMDMQMPVMDGYVATGVIRSDSQLEHLKVLALTARAMRHKKEACFASGCDLYQAKPVSFERLSRRISALLALGTAGVPSSRPPPSTMPPESIHAALAQVRERYEASLPQLEQDLNSSCVAALGGDAKAMETLRATLHRVSGTSGSMYFTALSRACADACTTVRALQRAYPDPASLPPESRQAIVRAIQLVTNELLDPDSSLPSEAN